jgi:hypothetical protein
LVLLEGNKLAILCVLMLLCTCPHATTYVSSYFLDMCAQVKAIGVAGGKQACYIMCPHATVSSCYYIRVLMLLHMCLILLRYVCTGEGYRCCWREARLGGTTLSNDLHSHAGASVFVHLYCFTTARLGGATLSNDLDSHAGASVFVLLY